MFCLFMKLGKYKMYFHCGGKSHVIFTLSRLVMASSLSHHWLLQCTHLKKTQHPYWLVYMVAPLVVFIPLKWFYFEIIPLKMGVFWYYPSWSLIEIPIILLKPPFSGRSLFKPHYLGSLFLPCLKSAATMCLLVKLTK